MDSAPTIKVVPFGGWANNLLLSNGEVEVLVTLDVGPRLLSYRLLPHGANVLKVYSEQLGSSGESEWRIRGGHRCWLAPEDCTRTYFADNRPCAWRQLSPLSAEVEAPPEDAYGVQKRMRVTLEASGTRLAVEIGVSNTGAVATQLSLWAPTVLAPGGVELIPLPPRRPHPGSPANASSAKDFGPSQSLVLWPYFDFGDSRWQFGSRFIALRHRPDRGPTKIGLRRHVPGWVAYLCAGTLFVKRFASDDEAAYADGTVFQTFSNEDMVEMETLGPFVTLSPGGCEWLRETWELHRTPVTDVHSEEEMDALLQPLLSPNHQFL